jgi:hypothetical protein
MQGSCSLSLKPRTDCCAAEVCVQAWRVAHPPVRGRWWLASRPLVHRGFFLSWTANGLNRCSL